MRTVACIDDDDVFVQSFSRNMRSRSIEVVHFWKAEDFFEEDDPYRFDMVLVDLKMAGTNGIVWEYAGIEVVKAIRRRYGEDLPVWVLTGYDNPCLIQTSVRNGAGGHLKKYDGINAIGDRIAAFLRAAAQNALAVEQTEAH